MPGVQIFSDSCQSTEFRRTSLDWSSTSFGKGDHFGYRRAFLHNGSDTGFVPWPDSLADNYLRDALKAWKQETLAFRSSTIMYLSKHVAEPFISLRIFSNQCLKISTLGPWSATSNLATASAIIWSYHQEVFWSVTSRARYVWAETGLRSIKLSSTWELHSTRIVVGWHTWMESKSEHSRSSTSWVASVGPCGG